MTEIQKIKTLLGNPVGQDELLETIVSLTRERLKAITGSEAVPVDLGYIVTEVSIIRFNRIGSEGYTSHTVEGETIGLNDNDFAPFMDDINAWKTRNDAKDSRKVRFI